MKKEGINYIIINSAFFIFIIYILFKLNILNTIINTIILVLISLGFSYILYPIYKKLNSKVGSTISIAIIYLSITLLLFIIIYSIIPKANIMNKIIDLLSNILKFEKVINLKYNLNLDLDSYIEKIISHILNNSIFFIKSIFKYISKILFAAILSICILLNEKYIIKIIKRNKHSDILFAINNKLKYFLIANLKIILVQFIEYTILFFIIGHPDYLLLGILNSINSIIPFVGVLLTNIIAITTASVISKKLFILTAIISIVMPQIDSYVINPLIYKSTNKIPQTLYIVTMIIGGSLFGIYGIILSLPILITIIEVLKYKNIVKQE